MDLPGMQLAPEGATKEALDAIPGLPSDLRAFLEQHDGGRGKVGNRPLTLWSAEQIAREAQSQEVSLATKGLLLFGTDGGAEGYGYLSRLRQRRYGRIPLIAAGAHEFESVGSSLNELLQALQEGR
jgi:SMI1/KNR4 family protein SUKH-1